MKTYAEFVFSKLNGKLIQVYQGNSNIERDYTEYNHQVKTVIVDTLVEANEELILINAHNVHGISE